MGAVASLFGNMKQTRSISKQSICTVGLLLLEYTCDMPVPFVGLHDVDACNLDTASKS